MRIVGGRLKGRRLNNPGSDAIRPTSDRIREALFNILTHGIDDFTLENLNVLDLFAGKQVIRAQAIMVRGFQHLLRRLWRRSVSRAGRWMTCLTALRMHLLRVRLERLGRSFMRIILSLKPIIRLLLSINMRRMSVSFMSG